MTDARGAEVLNSLLRSAYDSADGFRQGASQARNPTFKALFGERAEAREQLIETITAELRAIGAEPVQDGTIIGEAHQLFMYARDALARGSDRGLIDEIVRREGLVTQNFASVADDALAPERARAIASGELPRLRAERDELERLAGGSADDRSTPGTWKIGEHPMAAHFKITDEDKGFLATPAGAAVLFAGSSGTQTWIERAEDSVVRLGVQSVGVATGDGGSLSVAIEVGGEVAKGEDGPAPMENRLSASQSVQVLVKSGERVAFKAYPSGQNAQVLRTVVWALDLDTRPKAKPASDAPAARTSEPTP